MEDDNRPFEPVNIRMIGRETGQERFTRHDIYGPPPVSRWRNNLTALSSRFDLYFVASRDSVAVYQPQFPLQKLGRTPQLFIPPTLAKPDASGYIDPSNPHAINHLIVGDLGTEEILLVATDSGNVTAYHTKQIREAIRKDPYRFSTNARADFVGVRAFFSQWVHESAWGLAIHTRARMIAVSANTPHNVPDQQDASSKITVFAFALSRNVPLPSEPFFDSAKHEEEREWYQWESSTWPDFSPGRYKNYKIILGGKNGHNNNVPCVAFVNTPEDTEGLWLLSTDIGGHMKAWKIWSTCCYKSWDFSERYRTTQPWVTHREGGWIVAAPDPRAFRLSASMDEFCGHSRAPQYYGHPGESYDISSNVRQRVPGNSRDHPTIAGFSDEDGPEAEELTGDPLSDSDDSMGVINAASVPVLPVPAQNVMQNVPPPRVLQSIHGRAAMTVEHSHTESEAHADDHGIASVEQNIPEVLILADIEVGPEDGRMTGESGGDELSDDQELDESDADELSDDQEPGESDAGERSWDDDVAMEEETMSDDASAYQDEDVDVSPFAPVSLAHGDRIYEQRKRKGMAVKNKFGKRSRSQSREPVPFIPAIYCSTSHVRFLNAPAAEAPHIFCGRLLRQLLPPSMAQTHHAHLDRLNMLLQIPELGIVIIATQIGRCAVCALTKKERQGMLGLRVDWILPTRSQEKQRLRPLTELLGIAVAPVQGQLDLSPSQPDFEEDWAEDCVVEGLPTSFERNTVLLDNLQVMPQDEAPSSEPSTSESDRDGNESPERKCSGSRTPPRVSIKTESRPWTKEPEREPWRSQENSRRYRLMMTYADMTVLTYEIWQGVGQSDVA